MRDDLAQRLGKASATFLARSGVSTWEQLSRLTEFDVLRIPGIASKRCKRIMDVMRRRGTPLKRWKPWRLSGGRHG